jgi:SPP1 family predicted phage head-tail adaptor
MQSGDLRHRITVEAQTKVSDGGGNPITTWIALPQLTNIAAAKWPLKSEEQFSGGRTVSIASYRIRIRYCRVFKSSWRIKDLFTGTYFSIVGAPVDLGDNHQFLELLCKEVTT